MMGAEALRTSLQGSAAGHAWQGQNHDTVRQCVVLCSPWSVRGRCPLQHVLGHGLQYLQERQRDGVSALRQLRCLQQAANRPTLSSGASQFKAEQVFAIRNAPARRRLPHQCTFEWAPAVIAD